MASVGVLETGSYVTWLDRVAGEVVTVAGFVDRVDGGTVYVALAGDTDSVISFGDREKSVGPVTMLLLRTRVRPNRMAPGLTILVPDASDPSGGRMVPRVVREAWSADTGGSIGRWLVDFDDSGEGFDGGDAYVHPFRMVTGVMDTYAVVTGYRRPDYSALDLVTVWADQADGTREVVRVTMVHKPTGAVVAGIEPDTEAERPVGALRQWRVVASDFDLAWPSDRWTDRDAAVRWVWSHVYASMGDRLRGWGRG